MRLPIRKPGKYSVQQSDPYITKDKFDELTKKLKKLEEKKPKLAKEVSRLAELGDFSENVEYQLAKGKLRGLNNSILKIKNQLKRAEIIKPKKTNTVQLGCTVTVENKNGKKIYTILGSSETNPQKGIISHNSPIGSALIGKKVDEIVKIKIRDNELEYKVIDIK